MFSLTKSNTNNTWIIYTDGSCMPNPGPGGYGIYAICNGREFVVQGGESHTTSNRMELMAVITALEDLAQPSDVRIYTDSQYVQLGITDWIDRWKRNGWRTANRKPVKNADLWTRLDTAAQRHSVEWIWIRAHDGNRGNERAHELAEEAARDQLNQTNGG